MKDLNNTASKNDRTDWAKVINGCKHECSAPINVSLDKSICFIHCNEPFNTVKLRIFECCAALWSAVYKL